MGCSGSIALILVAGCAKDLDRDALMDPASCVECHPAHVAEWEGSMHAYAAEDPVFRAMNARGQRETNGELGDFCVQCHAPLAVREGLTTDGLNLDDVPEHLRGVNCFFCHSAEEVTGDHNAPITLATDNILRGGISNPTRNPAHKAEYSELHDREKLASGDLCGSCHDIVTPAGVHLERTYLEWQNSLYSQPIDGLQQTCGSCHMQGRDDVAADYEGVPLRRVHSHRMAGVDVAITEFPDIDGQLDEVQRALNTVVAATMTVCDTGKGIEAVLTLDNVAAGHSFPSGATQDRRVWIELVASTKGQPVFSTGVIADDEPVASVDDPNLWRLGERMLDASGAEVHMFWEAHTVEGELLPAPTSPDPNDPAWIDTHIPRTWTLPAGVDEIHAVIRMRPVGLDVIDLLIESGDLDAGYREVFPTFTLEGSAVSWTADEGFICP